LTAVFVAGWRHAPAWQVGTFCLLVCCQHLFSLSKFCYQSIRWKLFTQQSSLDRCEFTFADLFAFHHPGDQSPSGNANRKRRRNREHEVPLEALRCVVQEFFGSITALPRGASHCSYAIPNCIRNRAGGASRLVSRLGDVIRRSFHYGL
jgi:hypothetical protein